MVATIDHRNVIPVFDARRAGRARVRCDAVRRGNRSDRAHRAGGKPGARRSARDRRSGRLGARRRPSTRDRPSRRQARQHPDRGADGRVFLADFGVATQSGTTRARGEGLIVGTIDYCAPEQLEGSEVGPAADVYALGCVLFQSLTGHRPFERDTDVAVFHAQLLAPPPSLLALRPDLPPALEDGHHQGARQGAGAEVRKLPSARRRRQSGDRRVVEREWPLRRGTGARAAPLQDSRPPDVAARPPTRGRRARRSCCARPTPGS